MSTINNFIKSHPVLTYYIFVFTISWGGMLVLVAPYGIPGTGEQVERMMLPALLVLFAGPSISGILMTGLINGRAGFRDLLSRLSKWRVDAIWYAVALLFAPLLVMLILLLLSLPFPELLPRIFTESDKLTLLLFGIAWGLIGGGLLEELGWTGFAIPTLRRHYGAISTGLIVGILWGVWHFLITYWSSGTFSGTSSLTAFLPAMVFYVGSLPAYRILMVRIHDRTGSLLVVMLMHAVYSASKLIMVPLGLALVPNLIYESASAVTLWIVVAVAQRQRTLIRQRQETLPIQG
jgi:membrane protease YdiL (CAAX protease family)